MLFDPTEFLMHAVFNWQYDIIIVLDHPCLPHITKKYNTNLCSDCMTFDDVFKILYEKLHDQVDADFQCKGYISLI